MKYVIVSSEKDEGPYYLQRIATERVRTPDFCQMQRGRRRTKEGDSQFTTAYYNRDLKTAISFGTIAEARKYLKEQPVLKKAEIVKVVD